ncbi:unnamed protein product (macronuclear) [Paramecium tetraurelia]|uniref:Uncharacterized protein n=1 Tax=Paramecium tetraurelia TaxID=5888 RepID=A0C7U9_PARTE|nr:uncharacterized protein GSPATT00035997001 [Paramecium tetraurelia]CAK66866.1 unnamed protein product [Paramecium tetraurelia]|eukprot:XP_001434263.1 hypothetical protein (macronuclear) [Paramecium tetraurelia strain d4-2]
MNGRLSCYQFHSEINIEREAAEMASRIMDRVRQKQYFRSNQKLTIKGDGGFRSSEYQVRPMEVQSIRHGTNSITDRNQIKLNLNFRQPQKSYNFFEQNPKHIEIIKKSDYLQMQQSQGLKDIYHGAIKLNNVLEPQSQSTSDKPDKTKLIKLMKA